jgi:hypothetical protein
MCCVQGTRISISNPLARSALTLLETGVLLVDHKDLALATNDLAVLGATLDTRLNFHDLLLSPIATRCWVKVNDP